MDQAKQKRLKRIYKAQAEMSQGVKVPHLKTELIKNSGMGIIEDSAGNALGYGLIFPRRMLTPEIKNMSHVGLGVVVGGGAEIEEKKLTAYQMFVKENSAKVRAKLSKKGMKGRELNTAVMVEMGKMWSKSK